MQRSTLTLVVVLSLILGSAVLWIALQDGSVRRGADVSNSPAASPAEDGAPAPVDLDRATPTARVDDTGPDLASATNAPEASAPQREAVPESTDAADQLQIQVRVVDGELGQPVEGISVFARFIASEVVLLESGLLQLGNPLVNQEDVDRWDARSVLRYAH